MSSVPRDLKKWYEDAVKEGKRASVKSGVSYVLFDRTGLSDEQIKLLSKEQGWRRVRYIGQSKAKNGKRPLQHFTDAINEVDADVFSNIKIEAFVNALKGGAEIVPIVVFDDIPIQWLNTFEYCFIVALRYLTKRFGDAAELWNISAGSIQPDDKLFGKDPVKQIEFGVLLALLAHRNVITVEIEEEEDAPDNQDIGTDNDVDMSGDD